jgi:hypothetical protein
MAKDTAYRLITTREVISVDCTTLVAELEHSRLWAAAHPMLAYASLSDFMDEHTAEGRVIVADHTRPGFITYVAYNPKGKAGQ